MDNIKVIEVTDVLNGAITEHIIIDHGNGEFTSMSKAVWDEQQKAAELGGTF